MPVPRAAEKHRAVKKHACSEVSGTGQLKHRGALCVRIQVYMVIKAKNARCNEPDGGDQQASATINTGCPESRQQSVPRILRNKWLDTK
ncbi:hypothetical protein HPB52_006907 [Rhipicephalus sanguineus]|uniref:Uncharacterized protein n=1 Tax=Rhipicephalus sanguineus TaxID=34632 RepID=A0A9D4QIF7_RHISA|nr:hypothetical protein HPB52_006907 [Rhipicephalus sanguineus]